MGARRVILASLLSTSLLLTGCDDPDVKEAKGDKTAKKVGIALPVEYPVGEELPDLGDTPGPLAAVWVAPRVGGGAPEVVGLVAETGTFGTLPTDLPDDDPQFPEQVVVLSPDGRRIAYSPPTEELVVRDLVSGEKYSPAFENFETRAGYAWVDATHLVGHVGVGTDVDGWVWEPGKAPKLVDLRTYPGSPYLGPQAGRDPWFLLPVEEMDLLYPCPTLLDMGEGRYRPVLCDVLGVIGSEIALTHDGSGTVFALDIHGVLDPALRHVVATAGGPERVRFATDLIQEALDAD